MGHWVSYWLSYFYIDNYKEIRMKEFGFHWVSSGNVKNDILHRKWLGRVNYGYHIPVRPVARLKSNIEVYFDGFNENKPLEIRTNPRGINA